MRWLQVRPPQESIQGIKVEDYVLNFATMFVFDLAWLLWMHSHPCSDALFERQAQVYGDILEACLNNTGCTGFETWGFVSNQTANTKNVRIDNHSSLWWGGVAPCWVNILLSEDRLILPGVVLVRAARRLICTRGWALERDPFPST